VLVVSDDQGATWNAISAALPFDAVDLVYPKARKAFYVPHFTCGFNGPVPPVPADAIMQSASIIKKAKSLSR